MNTIEQFLSEHSALSSASKKEFEQIFTLNSYARGDIIAGNNQTESKFFILQEGIVCSYLNDQKGKKYIRTLFTPISVIASLKSIINQSLVNVDYHCLTDCTLLQTNYDSFLTLKNKHHDIANLYCEILEQSYSKLIDRVTQLTTLEATERYLLLKKMIPGIENQIPLQQIAQYLNITPVQLSRIRSKLVRG